MIRFIQTRFHIVVVLQFFIGGADSSCAAQQTIEVTDCIVRFADEVDVPAIQAGRVAEIMVNLNDHVEFNASLARLDDRSVRIRLRTSELRLKHAEREANDDVELRYAETALAEAKAEHDSSRSIHKDVSGAVPMSHLRRLRLAVERGELEVALAKKRRIESQMQVELRQADLSILEDEANNLLLTSPLSGTVIELAHSEGEWIEKGEKFCTVGRMDRLRISALVHQDVLARETCKGVPVSVHWDDQLGVEKSLRGKVLSIDPQMLPGGRYRLHAEIVNRRLSNEDTSWMLLPGMNVRIKVDVSGARVEEVSRQSNLLRDSVR